MSKMDGFLALVLLFGLSLALKLIDNKQQMVVNAQKNENRKKQLELLKKQEKKLENELSDIIDRLDERFSYDLNEKQFDVARRLSIKKQEIETLEERIV